MYNEKYDPVLVGYSSVQCFCQKQDCYWGINKQFYNIKWTRVAENERKVVDSIPSNTICTVINAIITFAHRRHTPRMISGPLEEITAKLKLSKYSCSVT